ncbi:MAG: LTA synthase family protein [Chitinophagales bacterium]
MKWALQFYGQFKRLLFAGLVLLLIYSILRILFWVYNRVFFMGLENGETFRILYSGVKQDFMTILILNAIPMVLLFAGEYFPGGRKYQYLLGKWIFVLLNTLGIALNVLDIGYFSYSLHRTNFDLLFVMIDSMQSFKSLLHNYWFLVILFAILVWIIFKIAWHLFRLKENSPRNFLTTLANQLVFLLILALVVKRPNANLVLPGSPLLSVGPARLPVAQNSFYTFVYSLLRSQKQIRQKNYYSPKELDSLARSVFRLEAVDEMKKKNVVIFILESFSRGYLLPGDPLKANTPFFDSLISQSIFFPNAFANGFNSNQGIVSILGGLPAFLDDPFYYSVYANTPLQGIGNILKEKGYNTSFFMGAKKDHFGFEKFGRMAGIEDYYWREQFNDENAFDGNWGIFDEPFLQYGADILSKKTQPFFAVFFNISSHPPFTIPASHKQDFIFPNQTPAQRAISYVDFAFRKFFERISKESWFQESVFIFCADHYLYAGNGTKQNGLTVSEIPVFIFQPGQKNNHYDSSVISQVDLGPSVLHLLNYSGRTTGFGKDIFDIAINEHFALNKPGHTYQIFSADWLFGYDLTNDHAQYLYQYRTDSLLTKNLLDSGSAQGVKYKLEKILKANIQLYQKDLLNRSLE